MDITYSSNRKISAKAYIELLCITSLKDRRPLNDIPRIEEMLKNTNLLLTAWDGNLLVGLARSVTDYAYCCYVSDLCVMETYQRHGIGKKLLMLPRISCITVPKLSCLPRLLPKNTILIWVLKDMSVPIRLIRQW